ncbi:hypothetical protein CP08DC60_1192 [Chlamydia psittaci 08DC60]|nr:hypothetical protein CP08DC60_1192 [Chlamydia psittaci 08DC60]
MNMVSSGQNRFQPVWCGLSWSKPVRAVQNRFVPVKTALNRSGLV